MHSTEQLALTPLSLWGTGALFIVLAYFMGSVPFGYLAGKMRGIDLREHGSGNIGATNAVRVLGKKIGLSVFVLDFLKGLLPVLLVKGFAPAGMSDMSLNTLFVLTAMAAVLGHTYTCWLGFKGGKGVATAAGVLVALLPWSALAVVGIWAVVFGLSRYVSLASILGALSFPVFVLFQFGCFSGRPLGGGLPLVVFSFIICLLVVLKHVANIKRLLAGTESRAFSGKK